MEALKRSLWIGLVSTALCSLSIAGPCQTVTADNLAADDGCTLTASAGIFATTTLTYSNFMFAVGTVTAPGGFAARDNTISFSVSSVSNNTGTFPTFTVTDTGDSLWNLARGEWGFTLEYTVATVGSIGYNVSEEGASATGTGGSSISGTIGGVTSTASTSDPNPPVLLLRGGSLNVTEVVLNNADSGTSNLTSVSSTIYTPEPTTAMFFGSGLCAFALLGRLRQKSKA